ncbi:hypothetical protein ACLB2K_032412 [Fragaria x ananassa]
MALNWEAVPQFFDSDMTCIQQNLEAELVGDFLQCVNADYSNPHNFLDPWYDTCSLLNFENSGFDHLHPPSFKPDMFPYQKTSVENVGKKVEERSVSPQSIVTRERRRKITEKTQELGKLVPGGSKMNTAEMLTAAYNYVKFLQAQMGILQFMGSFQEVTAATATKDLHVAACPTIQEKLYMEQKCLVPKEFMEDSRATERNKLQQDDAVNY